MTLEELAADPEALRRLVEEHRLLKESIEQSPGQYCVYDKDNRLVAWNKAYERVHPEAFAGIAAAPDAPLPTYEAILRQSLSGRLTGADLEAEIETLVARQNEADGVQAERYYEGTGWLRVMKFALPGGGVAGIAMDIDDLKTREAELEDARAAAVAGELAKTEFLSHMSHEIRTPLNGVIGMAELLRTTELDERQQLFVDSIANCGGDLLRLINDVLDVAKFEAGEMEIARRSFDLYEVIEDVGALFAASAAEKGLRLNLRIDPVLPRRAVGDGPRLRQILLNLVNNAIKFTSSGRVLIEASPAPPPSETSAGCGPHGGVAGDLRLRLSVEDSGPGVPPAVRDRIFERFSQGDAKGSGGQQGTGLGLAIVASLAALLGGGAAVADAPGGGARFSVDVVLERDRAAQAAIAEGKRPQGLSGAALVVDPDPETRGIVAERLADFGFATTEAGASADPWGGAVRCDGAVYDLAVLRVGAVGAAAVRHLREAKTPVIAVSTIDDATLERTAEDWGGAAWLTLPLRVDHFRRVAAKALDAGARARGRPVAAGRSVGDLI